MHPSIWWCMRPESVKQRRAWRHTLCRHACSRTAELAMGSPLARHRASTDARLSDTRLAQGLPCWHQADDILTPRGGVPGTSAIWDPRQNHPASPSSHPDHSRGGARSSWTIVHPRRKLFLWTVPTKQQYLSMRRLPTSLPWPAGGAETVDGRRVTCDPAAGHERVPVQGAVGRSVA